MKYYDEEKMAPLRAALEKEILRWPGVKAKEMMGCLCYFHGTKFFAFLVTKGVVVTKLTEEGRASLTTTIGGKPFEMSGRTAKTWVQVSVARPRELTPLLPFIKASYEATRTA